MIWPLLFAAIGLAAGVGMTILFFFALVFWGLS